MRPSSRILHTAEIAPNTVIYSLLSLSVALLVTLVGIPFLPIALPIGAWYYHRYFARLSVVLTNRDLLVQRGILVREQKSIPLEKITDLAIVEGPIMRWMGIKGMRVETAGQGAPSQGALVKLIGIVDTDGFRDQVLAQRDKIADAHSHEASPDGGQPAPDAVQLLTDVRDALRRIENKLA